MGEGSVLLEPGPARDEQLPGEENQWCVNNRDEGGDQDNDLETFILKLLALRDNIVSDRR